MIKTLIFENFRGFEHLSMNLTPVTLISGENNVGKTSILEGLFILRDFFSRTMFTNIMTVRSITGQISSSKVFEPLFNKMNIDNRIIISTEETEANECIELKKKTLTIQKDKIIQFQNTTLPDLRGAIDSGQIDYSLYMHYKDGDAEFSINHILSQNSYIVNPNPNSQAPNTEYVQYIGPTVRPGIPRAAEWFGKVELSGLKHKLVDALRILDSNIDDVLSLIIDGNPAIYIVKNNGEKLPIEIMGDGISKILFIILVALAKPNCTLLLDEVENGLHYSIQSKFWELLMQISKMYNVQIVATTHSYECIQAAAVSANTIDEHDFSYVRLSRVGDRVEPRVFSVQNLALAIQSELEVR